MRTPKPMCPPPSVELAARRRALAPETQAAFEAFSKQVFADGALPAKIKQLIAVAVAHVTQRPYCIKGHTTAVFSHGATPEELMEAIWVAAEMLAGSAYPHSALSFATIAEAHTVVPTDMNSKLHGKAKTGSPLVAHETVRRNR